MRLRMNFVALDVETANPNMASICQIGIARFADGALAEEWKTYVDPQDYFDGMNVTVHGIHESTVVGAPTFPQVSDALQRFIGTAVVVTHTHFDRTALHQAAGKYGLTMPTCTWLDSARVARRSWEEFADRGYGLSNVCRTIGYEFKHHDALEDAKAAAMVVLAALQAEVLLLFAQHVIDCLLLMVRHVEFRHARVRLGVILAEFGFRLSLSVSTLQEILPMIQIGERICRSGNRCAHTVLLQGLAIV